jgi:hypothetical protein
MQDDVFWLKENAELLGILACTGTPVSRAALAPHDGFYAGLAERLQFFPQYYRFLLSVGLDLEDLGMPGHQMEALCHHAARDGLPDTELSDLQRGEARRLLARRGVFCGAADPGLDDRLRAFIGRPDTFALPNKKAAYELTHIVFYLSEYGRCDPCLPDAALRSLHYAGILAHLDQNIDLLAEVCVALRQAGGQPAPIWINAVRDAASDFTAVAQTDTVGADDYHEYLVSAWAIQALGFEDTGVAIPAGRVAFHRAGKSNGALRGVSGALLAASQTRSNDWDYMRDYVFSMLDDDAAEILDATVASTSEFGAFFEVFARA